MSTADRPLRIGFLGSGFMAGFHLEALNAVRHCEVTAVHSPTPTHCRQFAERATSAGLGSCRALPTAGDLISSDEVDAVWVVGPNDTRLEHMRLVHQLVASGEARLLGVAVEKPLGRNLAEAQAMFDLARDAGLNHGYLENQVFAPAVRRGKEVLWDRAVPTAGRPYLVRASEEHSGPHRSWFWQGPRQGGGVLLDMMCHSVEVARFLLTAPGSPRDSLDIRSATGTTSTLKWSRPEQAALLRRSMGADVDYLRAPAEDVAHGTLELVDEDGLPLRIETSTSWAYVGPGLRIAIEVLGPEYSMSVDTLSTNLKVFLSRAVSAGGTSGHDLIEKQNAEQGNLPVLEDEAVTYGYVAEDRHMVESFRSGARPEETFADGVEVIEALMALYLSAELERTVRPGEVDLTSYRPPVARGGAG
ncbi:MAG: Gfo/Idh/MocA family protein [Acidimicrobiales bacterium]